jgi:hypothetical protein
LLICTPVPAKQLSDKPHHVLTVAQPFHAITLAVRDSPTHLLNSSDVLRSCYVGIGFLHKVEGLIAQVALYMLAEGCAHDRALHQPLTAVVDKQTARNQSCMRACNKIDM